MLHLIRAEEARRLLRGQSPGVPASGSHGPRVQDLPVCFPARPCVEHSPLEADAINLTSSLTPVSPGIAIGCFVVLGVALALLVVGLRPWSRRGPGLWTVPLSTALALVGVVVAGVVDARFDAISSVYGVDGPGGPELFASWSEVELAGGAMALAGVAGLIAAATVAILRLRSPTAQP